MTATGLRARGGDGAHRIVLDYARHQLNNLVSAHDLSEADDIRRDRGSQFRSLDYVRTLRDAGLFGSMGRVGACADNAAMESFFSLLQKNVLDRQRWQNRHELRSRSPSGSNGPTIGGDANAVSAASPPSSSNSWPPRPKQLENLPTPPVNRSRGRPLLRSGHDTQSPSPDPQAKGWAGPPGVPWSRIVGM
jgi:transposase InsO family protein